MKAIILHKSGIFSILFIFNMFVCKGQIEYNTLRAEIIANSTVGAGDTLFATAVGGTTWQWTGPNNFTSSSRAIAIPNTNTTNSGLYSVNITDSIRDTTITVSKTITIDPNINSMIQVNSTLVCEHSTLFLEYTNPQPGYTYQWTSNLSLPFTPSNNVYNPIIADIPIGTFHITLQVTDNNSNITTESIEISVINCCTEKASTIFNQITTSQAVNIPNIESIVVINGVFNVTNTYSFPANVTEIIMLPGSSITNSVSLTLNNLHIHGCEEMWKGITNNKTLIIDNTILEDAIFAVYSCGDSSTNTIVINSTFIDNFISIWKDLAPLQNMEIGNSKFQGTLNEFLLPPFDTYIPDLGIFLCLTSPQIISLYNGEPCYFSNLSNGIHSKSTDLIIKEDGAFFDNINSPVPSKGAAIATHNHPNIPSLLKCGGSSGSFGIPTIWNSKIGIYCNHLVDFEGFNNEITEVGIGIIAIDCKYHKIEILGNTIHAKDYGIQLTDNAPSNYINVKSNNIFINQTINAPYNYSAITIQDNQATPFGQAYNQIDANTISIDGITRYGIKINNAAAYEITENTIQCLSPTENIAGIYLTNCVNQEVRCNTLLGIDYTQGNSTRFYPIGLYVDRTTSSRYSCNSFDQLYTGTIFEQSCIGTVFRGNRFYNLTKGLHISSSGLIDDQYNQGNKWFAQYYPGCAAERIPNTSTSRFFVGPNCQYCMPPNICATPSDFFNNNQNSNFDCELMNPSCISGQLQSLISNDSSISETDIQITQNNIFFQEYVALQNWNNDRFLINKLNSNPSLINTSNIIEDYYTTSIDSTYKIFEDIAYEIVNSISRNAPIISLITQISQERNTILDSVNILDSLINQQSNSSNTNLFRSSKLLLYSILNILQRQLNECFDSLSHQRSINMQPAYILNSSLSVNQDYEVYTKQINELLFDPTNISNFKYTNTEINTIRNIACQCPLIAGPASYIARSIYAINSDTLINDYENCLAIGLLKNHSIGETEGRAEFKIFPSPTSSNVNISWNIPSKYSAQLKLFSIDGKLIQSTTFSLDQLSFDLDVNNLNSGYYILQISTLHSKFYKNIIKL